MLALSDVLRCTALLVNRLLEAYGERDDLLGQSGDASFGAICAAGGADAFRLATVDRVNTGVIQHCSMAELTPDGVRVADTLGRTEVLPLLRPEAMDARGGRVM